MSKKMFYSNGKLLLTGEYVVLDGAKALALPTVFGQNFNVEDNDTETIFWKSYNSDQSIWVEARFPFSQIIEKSLFSDDNLNITLANILHQAYLLNPNFLSKNKGYMIETHLTFPKFWGLGTSSTLINNIAKWLNINPYELLKHTFGGSGYDIACAQSNKPILFHLTQSKNPIVKTSNFNPEFSKNLYFVYLNKKQNSRDAITNYYKKKQNIVKIIPKINLITTKIEQTQSIFEFTDLLEKHEQIISSLLETEPIKKRYFPDFKGNIKSLGAWNGDFVLAISQENPTEYFEQKGFKVVISYKKMIL